MCVRPQFITRLWQRGTTPPPKRGVLYMLIERAYIHGHRVGGAIYAHRKGVYTCA